MSGLLDTRRYSRTPRPKPSRKRKNPVNAPPAWQWKLEATAQPNTKSSNALPTNWHRPWVSSVPGSNKQNSTTAHIRKTQTTVQGCGADQAARTRILYTALRQHHSAAGLGFCTLHVESPIEVKFEFNNHYRDEYGV